ncbi:2-C-methyl-D-erythritol 2,4-cyclodiphosphate synthase [Aeromonas caviae]|uniref:2-C-methyl-D-erythritol 2,4-cyclodiphosphate synthase n=1 Tax=Aeromonas caviae TaxID=648 RepID=UPI003C2AC112
MIRTGHGFDETDFRVLEEAQALMRIGHGLMFTSLAGLVRACWAGWRCPMNRACWPTPMATVVLHAVERCPAGAIGAGDIGRHFPDTAAEFKGIDSRILLRECLCPRAARRLCHRQPGCDHHRPGPKMAPHIDAMCACWPRICNVI